MGKSGSRIVATRESTGAKIKVSDKPLEDSTDKTIIVHGTSDAVRRGLTVLAEQIAAAQDAGSR
jgi:hypothetical protein